MKRRIVIVSNGHLCRNPRVLKEAHALGCAGYDVTVLTVRNHAASEAHDREILQQAPFRREVIDLLAEGSPEPVRAFQRRLLLWAARKLASLGRPTVRSLGPAGALYARVRQLNADLTIVHNEIAHWAGTRLLRDGLRVAADIEDWHSEDLPPANRRLRPIAQLREIERSIIQACVYTTTTSHALAAALQARYGGNRPHVISNSFPLQPLVARAAPGQPPAFFWFSQTLGPGRGLEQFVEAWGRLSAASRLVLLGESRADYLASLLGRVPAAARARVTVLPLVPPAKLPALIAQHDIGLALEDPSIPNKDLTISNKILQYLNAGLAVLAGDTAGQREVLAGQPEAGVIVRLGDPAALASAMETLLSDPAALSQRQHAARRLAETKYCWEREAPALEALVAQALQAPVLRRANPHDVA